MPRVRDRETLAQEVAETYKSNPWERVEEYRRVMEYTADHPQQGSSAVASVLDLPRSRIRTWVDGDGMPDPMRGVLACETHDWLDLEYGKQPFSGLNVLLAWIFSGGSISHKYDPRWALDGGRDEQILGTAFERVGVDYRIDRHDDAERATELAPTTDARPLGRLLVALGAPQGTKNDRADLSLPAFLDDAPRETRLAFVRTFVRNRGVERSDRPNWPLQIIESRPRAFQETLCALFRSLVDDPESVRLRPSSTIAFGPATAEHFLEPPFDQDEVGVEA